MSRAVKVAISMSTEDFKVIEAIKNRMELQEAMS